MFIAAILSDLFFLSLKCIPPSASRYPKSPVLSQSLPFSSRQKTASVPSGSPKYPSIREGELIQELAYLARRGFPSVLGYGLCGIALKRPSLAALRGFLR